MQQIALIGIDGSGKTTQAAKLVEAINNLFGSNKKAVVSKSAGLNYGIFDRMALHGFKDIPDSIRAVGYGLDMCNKYLELINNAEENIYVWDRYSYCIEAYFEALGVDMEDLNRLFSFFTEPSMTFLLDVDAELAMERLKLRGEKLKPGENFEFLKEVRQHYLELAKKRNFIVIDASKDKNEIHDLILASVKMVIKL